ncbi:MAG: hypothetical protein JXA99_13355, partial [Candidatus Lokiarchaeota archaeon]|nr:hypothetical protein [Candidatus Lokiarchaeota archaeon]
AFFKISILSKLISGGSKGSSLNGLFGSIRHLNIYLINILIKYVDKIKFFRQIIYNRLIIMAFCLK